MSLEKIAEHIEKETDTKVKRIVLEAQVKANSEINAAAKKADEIVKEAAERLNVLSEEKRNIERAKTNVERMNILKTAISDAFKESINNLYKAEDKFSKTKEYDKLLSVLIEEAKKSIGNDANIYLNKDDIKKLERKEKNLKVYDKNIFGIYAESKDGKISMDMSINKIIQSMEEKIARKVIDRLGK
jgi:vacuolar-type H+-ATPase subunit E/Vma4